MSFNWANIAPSYLQAPKMRISVFNPFIVIVLVIKFVEAWSGKNWEKSGKNQGKVREFFSHQPVDALIMYIPIVRCTY